MQVLKKLLAASRHTVASMVCGTEDLVSAHPEAAGKL